MNRRQFLQLAVASTATAALVQAAEPATRPANALPRWRGFNLLEMFDPWHVRAFNEADFEMLAGWGFNFVRIPLSYWCWSTPQNPAVIDPAKLKPVIDVVAMGRRHGVHVNLNLHRIPGYCVNPPREPAVLWTDPAMQSAAVAQWSHLAEVFADAPASTLSFDLINEPPDLHDELYIDVVTQLVSAIRAKNPERLIIADGLKWGTKPVPGLAQLKIGQSTRGYSPMQLSHYKAPWINGSRNWSAPTWPMQIGAQTWDRTRLQNDVIQPWQKLQQQGVGVHVGEWGAWNHTPHDVVMPWMNDCLTLWKDAGWGWSLWNLYGGFGILDSDRKDVRYENFRGHLLDREMLELLRAN
jgi:endoglucanase